MKYKFTFLATTRFINLKFGSYVVGFLLAAEFFFWQCTCKSLFYYNGVNLLSNTTIWWRDVYIFYYNREQLHVLALDNGHLQVVPESLSKQLYKHIYIYELLIWGRGRGVEWARDLESVRTVGTCGMHSLITA